MTRQRVALGRWGESLARSYLEERGCPIAAANWRCEAGEVDLIAQDGACLAFVEVRTRRGRAYGRAEESITPAKMARMAAVAEAYVYAQGWTGDWRLDVIAIQLDAGRTPAIEWYRNVSQ